MMTPEELNEWINSEEFEELKWWAEAYRTYGNYSPEGYFIVDYKKHNEWMLKPTTRKRKLFWSKMAYLIPILGIIIHFLILEEMGLQT